MSSIIKEQWMYAGIPLAMIVVGLLWSEGRWWFILPAIIGASIYLLFWYLQFVAATQMEQSKVLFQKLSYEFDSRQILIKLNDKQGSPLKWEMIKRVNKRKNDYLFIMGRGQFFLFPYKIFNSDNDLRFLDSILERKGLLK
ncbi:MAG: YcxB family protein [Cytophagaceae bacterium]|nr:YcxB family protein [Cytophagaceae bacterium]